MTPQSKDPPNTADPFAALGQVMGELVHDLANDIAVLQSWALLADGELAAGRAPDVEVKRVVEISGALGHMLRDVLATLVEDGLSPEVQFDPAAVAESVISRRVRDLPALGIRFRSDLPKGTTVRGRHSFWVRTVANLLGNSTRYARGDILVTLALDRSGSRTMVVLRVEDDGPGVPAAEREDVFRPGWRGEPGGSGLGLSSVAWSVAQLGGEVCYREGSPLGGAAFEVRVPAAGPLARRAANASAGSGVRLLAPPPSLAASPSLAGLRLLVIDDDEGVRQVLGRLLRRVGADVRELDPVGEPEEQLVLEVLRTLPDVVLLDLRLGERGGLSLWHRLRAELPQLARVVIFLTGASPGDPDWDAAAASGQPVLNKPFEVAKLALAIRSLRARG
jgi:CheY-like chemotaxis protein